MLRSNRWQNHRQGSLGGMLSIVAVGMIAETASCRPDQHQDTHAGSASVAAAPSVSVDVRTNPSAQPAQAPSSSSPKRETSVDPVRVVGSGESCAASRWKNARARRADKTMFDIEFRDFGTHNDALRSAAFSLDGSLLYACGDEPPLEIWSGSCPGRVASVPIKATLCALSPSPISNAVAVTNREVSGVSLILPDGTALRSLDAGGKRIGARSVAFSSDGTLVAAGDDYGSIFVWPSDGSSSPRVLSGHTSRVVALVFAAGGRQLVSGGGDGTIRFWDIESGSSFRILTRGGPQTIIFSLALTHDGRGLIVGESLSPAKNQVTRLDVATGEVVWSKPVHNDYIYAVDVSNDGTMVASGGADNRIVVRDGNSGELLFSMEHRSRVNDVGFSPDGRFLVSASGNGQIGGVPGPDNSLRIWKLPEKP